MDEDEELGLAKAALKQAMMDGDRAAMDAATKEIVRIKNFKPNPDQIIGWTKPARTSDL